MKYAWMDEYLMNKTGVTKDLKEEWNSIKPDGEVSDDLLMEMLDKSYALVLHSFSKKRQQEILLTTSCGL
ncbi:MAG: hypothetical protein J6A92_04615 [Lachnospiraceae bacterium]|nr:hypothetical protein [Lachnospiraceae bacterium]